MTYFLSLGANIGQREQTLRHAIELIGQQIGHVLRCSSFYYSEPWGFVSANEFCNMCCMVETDMAPLDVLHATQSIEHSLGRKEKSVGGNYSDRCIDIDIIRAFDNNGDEIIVNYQLTTTSLQIPHPLWRERDFVTIPMKEINCF